MIEIRTISIEENTKFINAHPKETNKFASKAFNFWYRTRNFDKNPPYGLFVDGELAAVCHITKSPKRKYCNLYYISTHPNHLRKGYAALLYNQIAIDFSKEGIRWIKLSSEKEATAFWIKMGFWFMGWDKTGSLRAACPLVVASELAREREKWLSDPLSLLPPENVLLDQAKPAIMKKIEANIAIASPYFKRFDEIKPNLDALIDQS